MIPYALYRLVHLVGLVVVMLGVGAIATAPSRERTGPRRGTLIAGLGLGAFLMLLGGFGMLARLGIAHGSDWPGWLWVKLGLWLTLVAAALLPLRFPAAARTLLLLAPVLAGLAAYMAIYKPL